MALPALLSHAELLRWVADLGCSSAPYVCGTCMPCRAEAECPDFERCPGSGETVDPEALIGCPKCSRIMHTVAAIDGEPERFPEHRRLREVAS